MSGATAEVLEPVRRSRCNPSVRIGTFVVAVALAALVLAPGGSSKEQARARLLTPLPLAAKPGSTIQVRWTVDVPDGQGGRRPFGASGMFVRLLSSKHVDDRPRGRWRALPDDAASAFGWNWWCPRRSARDEL